MASVEEQNELQSLQQKESDKSISEDEKNRLEELRKKQRGE